MRSEPVSSEPLSRGDPVQALTDLWQQGQRPEVRDFLQDPPVFAHPGGVGPLEPFDDVVA